MCLVHKLKMTLVLVAALFVSMVVHAEEKTLNVYAAASLTGAFKEIGAKFELEHPGVKVALNFGASNQLRMQIDQGAKADVFASANKKEMGEALKSGTVAAGADKIFARNKLTVIMPKDNPGKVTKLTDLTRKGLKVVLAAEQVPVGKYAAESFEKMQADPAYGASFKADVIANVVSREQDVKAVLAKVRLGEADAGIVYVSDSVGAANADLQVLEIPDNFNVIAEYPIAVLAKAPEAELAGQFVTAVLSEAGQASLKKAGFAAPAVK